MLILSITFILPSLLLRNVHTRFNNLVGEVTLPWYSMHNPPFRTSWHLFIIDMAPDIFCVLVLYYCGWPTQIVFSIENELYFLLISPSFSLLCRCRCWCCGRCRGRPTRTQRHCACHCEQAYRGVVVCGIHTCGGGTALYQHLLCWQSHTQQSLRSGSRSRFVRRQLFWCPVVHYYWFGIA